MTNTPLSQSLIERITATHEELCQLGQQLGTVLLAKVNKAREIGVFLRSLDEATPHGAWNRLFASANGKTNENPSFHFTAEWARACMRFAAAHPEPFTELPDAIRCVKDAMILTGALPEPERGKQQAHGPGAWVSQVTRWTMNIAAALGKEREKQPQLKTWPREVLQDLDEQLAQITGLHAEVRAALGMAAPTPG